MGDKSGSAFSVTTKTPIHSTSLFRACCLIVPPPRTLHDPRKQQQVRAGGAANAENETNSHMHRREQLQMFQHERFNMNMTDQFKTKSGTFACTVLVENTLGPTPLRVTSRFRTVSLSSVRIPNAHSFPPPSTTSLAVSTMNFARYPNPARMWAGFFSATHMNSTEERRGDLCSFRTLTRTNPATIHHVILKDTQPHSQTRRGRARCTNQTNEARTHQRN